jgi:DNA-binding transcriptional regulator LsrR (DeoR family)
VTAPAVRAVLRSGLVSILVAHTSLARELLGADTGASTRPPP